MTNQSNQDGCQHKRRGDTPQHDTSVRGLHVAWPRRAACMSQWDAIQLAGQESTRGPHRPTHPYWLDRKDLLRRYIVTYTIFEGRSQIQRLIIARAISGVHIR